MTKLPIYTLIYSLILLVGCSSSQYKDPMDNVIVDTAGVDLNKYYADLAECKAFAKKVDVRDQTTRGVVGGVIVGSVVGAIIGVPVIMDSKVERPKPSAKDIDMQKSLTL